jgi:tetratricopeptide (TPR) repeat protein
MAVKLEPERVELLTWAGRLTVNQNDRDCDIADYQKAWLQIPARQNVAFAYAELLTREGSMVQARQVLESLADAPEVRFSRVVHALGTGDESLAIQVYDGFPKGGGKDPAEWGYFAGQSAELLGRFDEAIMWYTLVERGERAVISALRRAFLLAQNDRLEEARNVLARMRVRRNPETLIESFETESVILRQADLLPEAFEILGQGIDLLPGNSRLIYAQALVAVELGKIDFAEQALRSVLQREPRNAAALNALGYTLADLTDRLDEAEHYINAAYAITPDEPSIIDSMGWLAYRQGRMQEAERYLRDALARDNNPEIAAHLGEVLWVSGQEEAARSVWIEALNQSENHKILLAVMARFGVSP